MPNDCEDTPCLNITINEETNSITAQCLDNDTGSCTFTNTFGPSQVPTLSEWGLIAMAGLLGIVGFMVIMYCSPFVKPDLSWNLRIEK